MAVVVVTTAVLSPKSQVHDVVFVDAEPSKLQVRSVHATVKLATGGGVVAVTVPVVVLDPTAFVTVSVTVYVPGAA
jgi:predicted O-methyltransferase YrrM